MCRRTGTPLWKMRERKGLLEDGNFSVHVEIPRSHFKGACLLTREGCFIIVISAQRVALIIV